VSSLYIREDLTEATVGSAIDLEGAEAKHAVAANRLRVGEQLLIGNGRGLIAGGVAEEVSPARLRMRVDRVTESMPVSPRVVLVQALAKGDRDELAVQASTELGVSAVIPWSAERSVSRWEGQKAQKGVARWQAIAREASKQSIRAWVPDVESVHSTAQLADVAGTGTMLVLEPTAEVPLSRAVVDAGGDDIVLVVGPEGGIAPRELAALTGAGATAVRLGSEVLRTSTAGPAAISAVNVILGRW